MRYYSNFCILILFFGNTHVFCQHLLSDSILVDARMRCYILYTPDEIPLDAPLVFVLHGYGGSAEDMMNFSKMNEVADENGFVVCYPQGVFGDDEKNSWNAGYSNDDVDDVKFLIKLAAYLQIEYKLSSKNTFCTGMSNGADMSYVLGCNASNVFSAIAPVAGCMMYSTLQNCRPGRSVPVFEIHGTADEITLYTGDPNYSETYGGYHGVAETIDFWVKNNDCALSLVDTLQNTNEKDNSYIIWNKYANNSGSGDIWLYKLMNGKHDWPGSWGNMDIMASQEIWNFFKRFIKE